MATRIIQSLNSFPKKKQFKPAAKHRTHAGCKPRGTGHTFNSTLRKSHLRRCSHQMRAKLEIYKDLRETFLKDKMCEFPEEPFGCRNQAFDVHHRKGRGRYLLDRRTWLPVCRAHHNFIEGNKKLARKMGLITYK